LSQCRGGWRYSDGSADGVSSWRYSKALEVTTWLTLRLNTGAVADMFDSWTDGMLEVANVV